MPTKDEVLDALGKIQMSLVRYGNRDLLPKSTKCMTVWGHLSDCVKNRRKDEVPDLFDELEEEIFQTFQITPEQLQKDRVDYAIGKNTVLSACKTVNNRQITGDTPKHKKSKTPLPPILSLQPATVQQKERKSDAETKRKRDNMSRHSEVQIPVYVSNHYVGSTNNDAFESAHSTSDTHTRVANHQQTLHNQQIEEELKVLRAKNEILQKSLKDTKKQLSQALEDKEYWVDRASKMTGDMLVHNNPDLADLSDVNRPQKLAERYSGLYDNEWTDAMETLADNEGTKSKKEHGERKAIKLLLEILKQCHGACIRIAEDQRKKLQKTVMLTPTEDPATDECPLGVQRSLHDAQKHASVRSLPFVRKTVLTELEPFKQQHKDVPFEELSKFIQECIDICWFMVVQSPRVCFLWPDAGKINKDRFREFTRSGDTLDFVVWPSMLNHQHGSLLHKGSVQPIAKAGR